MAEIGRKTENWGSRFGFIMAAVGSSVGLGNFWRFPFTAGENGGGAFILIYLVCVLCFGLPLLMAEYGMGRKSGQSAVEGVTSLARAQGRSQNWAGIAWVGSLAAFFILTFYSVISAWVIEYVPQAFSGHFSKFAGDVEVLNASIGANAADIAEQLKSVDLAKGCGFVVDGVITQQFNAAGDPRAFAAADVSGCHFGHEIGDQPRVLFWLALFLALNTFIVARGVRGGIERAATILMPAFFILLIGIVGFSLTQGDAAAAADFLLKPDFSEVSFGTFLAAVGQAFFSLSVGSALMVTYGAYLSADTNIPRSSAIVAVSDTSVALIAGFAIFPIVFAFGADPAGGPGLFFVSLPIAFGQLPAFVGGAFFALALFAALTSSISLMEVAVSWLEEREGVTRPGAAIGVGFVLFMIGAGYTYSTAFIDFADFMTGSLMLPLCGLLFALFGGWMLSRDMLTSEFGEGQIMNLWRFAMRWLIPPALTIILVFGSLDVMQNNGWIALPGVLELLLGPNA